MNTQDREKVRRCSALGGMCQAKGPHTQHWWSSEQMIRDLGMARAADGSLKLAEESVDAH